jgi:hypothetical protein
VTPGRDKNWPLPASLTTLQVCRELGVSAAWLTRHRNLFQWFPIPGRGRNGTEYRYSARSIEEYKHRSRRIFLLGGDEPPEGLTAKELTQWFAARKARRRGHEHI